MSKSLNKNRSRIGLRPRLLIDKDLKDLQSYRDIDELETKVNALINERAKAQKTFNWIRRIGVLFGLIVVIALLGLGGWRAYPKLREAIASLMTPAPGQTPEPISLKSLRAASPSQTDQPNHYSWDIGALDANDQPMQDVLITFGGDNANFDPYQGQTDINGMLTTTFTVIDPAQPANVRAIAHNYPDVKPARANIPALPPPVAELAVEAERLQSTTVVHVGDSVQVRFKLSNNSPDILAENVKFHLRLPDNLNVDLDKSDAGAEKLPDNTYQWPRKMLTSGEDANSVTVMLIMTSAGDVTIPAKNYWLSQDNTEQLVEGQIELSWPVEEPTIAAIELNPAIPYILPGLDYVITIKLLDNNGQPFMHERTVQVSADPPGILLTDQLTDEALTTSSGELRLTIPIIPFEEQTDLPEEISLTITADSVETTVSPPVLKRAKTNPSSSPYLRVESLNDFNNIAVNYLPYNLPVWLLPQDPSQQTYQQALVLLWVPKEITDIPGEQNTTIPGKCLLAINGFDQPPESLRKGTCDIDNKIYDRSVFLNGWPYLTVWQIDRESSTLYNSVIVQGWIEVNGVTPLDQ